MIALAGLRAAEAVSNVHPAPSATQSLLRVRAYRGRRVSHRLELVSSPKP